MRQILYFWILGFLSASVCYADTVVYVCTNTETKFVRVYEINTASKTVFFSKSKVSDTDDVANKGEAFTVERYEEVFDWDFPRIWTLGIDRNAENKNYYFNFFDFEANKLSTFTMEDAYSQTYKCF